MRLNNNQQSEFLSCQTNESGASLAFVFWFLAGLLLIVFDQITKHFAFTGSFNNFLNIFRPVAGKQNFLNYQFAFSLPVPVIIMYGIYLLAMLLIFWHLWNRWKIMKTAVRFGWVLIVAGAFSNIGERIALGRVRDFIAIHAWKWTGIYNVADGYIIFGIIVLLWCYTSQKSEALNNFKT